jgi:hypothetical protein
MTNKELAATLQLHLLELGKFQAQEKFHDELYCDVQKLATTLPADLQQAVAEAVEVLAGIRRLQARGPRGKTKSGRPGIWKSDEGLLLTLMVEDIIAEKHCTVARAIQKAIQAYPTFKANKAICRLKPRALQARYQEAVKYWSFLRGPYLEETAAMNGRLLAATERFATAFARWKATRG